jgi:enoyl-CoA hydratase/carnithine racemase
MEQSKITEWEVVDTFGILTINNPPQNFLTEPEFVGLSDLQRWIGNESLRGLIVQGKGRHFSAGADKNNILTAPDEEGIRNNLTKGKKVLDYLWDLPIPTIAAIRGVCFGGGLEVALSCHIRVCSDKALFSFPETGLGIMPGLHGTVKLPRIVGMAKAIDILLTGRTIEAQEALSLKLVDYVVPAKEVFDYSVDYLKRLTGDKPIRVIHAVVQSFINARKLSEDKAVERGSLMFCDLAVGLTQKLKSEQTKKD